MKMKEASSSEIGCQTFPNELNLPPTEFGTGLSFQTIEFEIQFGAKSHAFLLFFFFFCLRSCLIRVFINFLFSLLYILSILFFYLWRKTIKLDSFNNCVVTDLIILFISLEHFSEIRY